MSATAAAPRVSWKSLAIPTEHGGWGFTTEPVLLGLLVAPSASGAWLGVAAFGAFLARQPLKLALGDVRRGRTYPRTAQAAWLSAGFLLVALAALAASWATARGPFWMALAAALPLGLYHLVEDARGRSRALAPELAGAVAMASLASAQAMAAGWELKPALGLWAVLALRSLGSIPWVRLQVLRTRVRPEALAPITRGSRLSGGLVLVGCAAGTASGLVPALALPVLAYLAFRALADREFRGPARVLGFREMGLGLAAVTSAALGFWLGI